MGINVTKLFGTNVFGTNPIAAGGVHRVVSTPIQKPELYTSMNSLNKTYGQSPVVEDYAKAGQYFGDPVLRHIAYA